LRSRAVDALLVIEEWHAWAAAKSKAAIESTLVRELVSELGAKNVESREARRSHIVVALHAAIL
jgi:hypothetical protein